MSSALTVQPMAPLSSGRPGKTRRASNREARLGCLVAGAGGGSLPHTGEAGRAGRGRRLDLLGTPRVAGAVGSEQPLAQGEGRGSGAGPFRSAPARGSTLGVVVGVVGGGSEEGNSGGLVVTERRKKGRPRTRGGGEGEGGELRVVCNTEGKLQQQQQQRREAREETGRLGKWCGSGLGESVRSSARDWRRDRARTPRLH